MDLYMMESAYMVHLTSAIEILGKFYVTSMSKRWGMCSYSDWRTNSIRCSHTKWQVSYQYVLGRAQWAQWSRPEIAPGYSKHRVNQFVLADHSGRAVYAWNVFARSNTGIVGSNPTQGIDASLHLFCVCVVSCVGSGLESGLCPVQRVLPAV
jgi:hypothetical protein